MSARFRLNYDVESYIDTWLPYFPCVSLLQVRKATPPLREAEFYKNSESVIIIVVQSEFSIVPCYAVLFEKTELSIKILELHTEDSHLE